MRKHKAENDTVLGSAKMHCQEGVQASLNVFCVCVTDVREQEQKDGGRLCTKRLVYCAVLINGQTRTI